MANLEPLKDLISRFESKGDYDIVYLGVPEACRPEAHLGKKVTQLTIDELIAWQRHVVSDAVGAVSGAAGRWQVIRKTLEEFGPMAGLTGSDLFTPDNQDRIFDILLARRGFQDFMTTRISDFQFANNIAQEWAAMPVVEDCQGAHRWVHRGETFYAGDKVNKAYADPEEFIRAIRAISCGPTDLIA